MDGTPLAQEVLAYLAGEGIELSEELEEAETMLRDRLLAIGAQALQKHLETRKLGMRAPAAVARAGEASGLWSIGPRRSARCWGR